MLGYRPFYNTWNFPDPDPDPYIADPNEGGLIHVDVAGELPKPSLWPWVLAGIALLLLAGSSKS